VNRSPSRTTWSEFAQPRSWSLPVKLVAVVAVPALFALTLGGLRVLDQSDVANDFDRANRIAALQEEYSQLAGVLQAERNQAVQVVADRGNRAPFEDATEATDRARSEATGLLGDQSDLNSGTLGALRQVDGNYSRLPQVRGQVLNGAADAAGLLAQYTLVIEPLLVFNDALSRQLSNPRLGGLPQAIGALEEAREQVAVQQGLVTAAIDSGRLLDPQAAALRAADSRLAGATSTVRSVLSDEQQSRYTGFAGSVAGTREQLKQSVVDQARADTPIMVAPQAWTAASEAVLAEIDAAESGARAELRAISTAQQEAASNRAGISSVLLLLAILLGAGIVYLVAKALVSSLRILRTSALDVAENRLPEAVRSMREGAVPDIDVAPVPVTTREEIGQVARAFDAVHSQAVRLAAEQATLQTNVSSMFANLSRRSQALAERQLKLIEQLESNEQDPDQLSNLFQLDSLATRMRRNSENLLVLSGTDLSKRAIQPVPVVDVLRAAISEVEQYQRVFVQAPPDVLVAGRAASDIVHLLAELVDNATNFSAPDTQVVMSSQRTPDGSVLIEITDRGVGMGGEDLTDANERLARPTALDVSVSRRMGLFVVGRLAARHGMSVRLGGGNSTTGTTASVTVPAYLLTAGVGTEAVDAPPSAPDPATGLVPGDEFVPTARPGVGGAVRSAPLAALIAGADAPVGSPGGPLPGTSTPLSTGAATAGSSATRNGSANIFAPSASNGSEPGSGHTADAERGRPVGPGADELPARRPGQLLGQAPSVPPPGADRPRAAGPGGIRSGQPRSVSEQFDPYAPRAVPPPAPGRSAQPMPTNGWSADIASVTEAFAAQPAAAPQPGAERSIAPQPVVQRNEVPQPDPPESDALKDTAGPTADQARSVPAEASPAAAPEAALSPATPSRTSADSATARTAGISQAPAQPVAEQPAAPVSPPPTPAAPAPAASHTQATGSRPVSSWQSQPPWACPTSAETRAAPVAADETPAAVPLIPPPGQHRSGPTAAETPATVSSPAEASLPSASMEPPAQSPPVAPPRAGQPVPPQQAGIPATGRPDAPRSPTAHPTSPAVESRTAERSTALSASAEDDVAPHAQTADDPRSDGGTSETTPIFEEIASAWFREHRPVPLGFDEPGADGEGRAARRGARPRGTNGEDADSRAGRPAAPGGDGAQRSAPTPPTSAPESRPGSGSTHPRRPTPIQSAPQDPYVAPTRTAPTRTAPAQPAPTRPAPAPQPASAQPTTGRPSTARPAPARPAPPQQPTLPGPVGSPSSAGSSASAPFASVADDGWRASAAAAELTGDELTRAGLPKRRPRARLVPGAAAPVSAPAENAPAAAPVAARTAEAIRGRLSSYQHGVRQGREVRMRQAVAGSDGRTPDGHDEEDR